MKLLQSFLKESLLDDFYLDFDDVNVYGVKLKEGKEAEYTCCICDGALGE